MIKDEDTAYGEWRQAKLDAHDDLMQRLDQGVADTGTAINTAANINATMAEAKHEIERLQKELAANKAREEGYRAEVVKLSGGLTRYKGLNSQLCDKSNRCTIRNARLEEQIALRDKQIVELRDALIYCKTAGIRLANVDAALAATSDLSNCIPCNAEPVAWRYENKNVKGNWYITWTEPPDGFNKRALYEAPQPSAEVERDAACWRMLPAFAEEYQINLLKLFDDIDAAMKAKQ